MLHIRYTILLGSVPLVQLFPAKTKRACLQALPGIRYINEFL